MHTLRPAGSPKPTTADVPPFDRSTRPRPDCGARAANLAWKLKADRLEREAVQRAAAEKLTYRLPALLADLDRRIERIEGAVVELARLVDRTALP